LSEIPTKTVPAFPSCSIYATFHAKQICLDFFIQLHLNEYFNHEFRHCGILFSFFYVFLIGSTHSPLYPILEHPK
jgi:hypothetical protein